MAEFDSSITAYFGGDTSGLKNAVTDAGATLGKLSDKVGDKIMGMRDMSHAIATALGLNIEKIAEKTARFITGMSAEMEEAYKKSETLQDQIFEKTKKLAEARLTDEQKYVLRLQERDALQQKITDTAITDAKSQLKVDELKLQLLGKMTEIQDYELKLLADANKEWAEQLKLIVSSGRAQEDALIGTLEGYEKVRQIKGDIEALEKSIQLGSFEGATLDEKRNELAARRAQLITAQAAAQKQNAQEEEKIYEASEKLNDSVDEMRKTVAGPVLDAQKDVSAELERQGKIEAKNAADALENAKKQLYLQQTIRRVGTDYDAQSTTALEGLAARLNANLDEPNTATGFGRVRDAQSSAFSTDPAAFSKSFYEGELKRVMDELNLRKEIVAYDKQYGDQATVRKYGDDLTSKALQGFVTEQQRTNTVLTAISQQLGNAGFAGAIR